MTRYDNMKSEIVKFNFESCNITVVKDGENIWFNGKDVTAALGYTNSKNAIKRHVEADYRRKMPLSSGVHSGPLIWQVSEPGLYALIFKSKLPNAKRFQKWVFSEVLPSIRKTGGYTKGLWGNQMQLKTESDLHYQIVRYIRKYHPTANIIPGLGELQDTSDKRIDGYNKGYTGGQPDIIILNTTPKYAGLAIELKTPNLSGVLSRNSKTT